MANVKTILAKIDKLEAPSTSEVTDVMSELSDARDAEVEAIRAKLTALEESVDAGFAKLASLPTAEESETDARGVDLSADAKDVSADGEGGSE